MQPNARILAIRLAEKLRKHPNVAQHIGVIQINPQTLNSADKCQTNPKNQLTKEENVL